MSTDSPAEPRSTEEVRPQFFIYFTVVIGYGCPDSSHSRYSSLRLVMATACFGCPDKWHALIDGNFGRKTNSEDLAVRRWETRTRTAVGGFDPLLVGVVPDGGGVLRCDGGPLGESPSVDRFSSEAE